MAIEVVFFCTHALDHETFCVGVMADILMLQKAAFRLAGWQVLLTGIVAAGAFWLGGSSAALSAVTGGGIGIVAGLYQALRMFRVNAALDPTGFMRGVYVGEAVKIVLTVALMIAAIRVLGVEMLPFMIGYIAIYSIYWIALKTGLSVD
jgi:ATP synthase protein I